MESAPTHPADPGNSLTRCGLTRRFLIIFYDAVIVIGLLLIATAAVLPFTAGSQQAFRDPLFTVYLLSVWFFYLGACWTSGGMTLGMRAWKIVLIADKGYTIDWKLCLVRYLVALFSISMAGLGLLWSVWEPEKRTWHDLASHSGLFQMQ